LGDGQTPMSICIVAHFAYGAMAGGETGHIGGVERQTSITARWLAERGYPVTMVTWDEGQDDDLIIDGVRILKLCRQDAGVPGLRFFMPRWSSLVRALRKADADLYYHNCAEYVTGQVALWCRKNGRGFVYSVANDPDCDSRLPEMKTLRERVLYRYGLRHADRVVVQTKIQQEMMRDGFGVESTVIPMPSSDPSNGKYVPREFPDPKAGRVLWIARVTGQKRPDRLIELAQVCSDFHFDFVGPQDGTDYAKRICQQAEELSNVTVHGPVSRDRVSDFYRRATCLCCTSDFEGFPNTFLEAWCMGLPIVSTFDPDNLIARKGLGHIAKEIDGLSQAIRNLAASSSEWLAASANARKYYVENHTVEAILPRFEEAFVGAVRVRNKA